MENINMRPLIVLLTMLALPCGAYAAAYGSLNNFDCVNDTGVEAHGFDIELDDVHSKDITYTYDYNHYGVPKITEDNSDPLHPKVLVRYASAKNPNGTWAAYTAIPSGPIAPTQGHQFTNPSINFGGEHFGVGYYPTSASIVIKYNWLIDDGSGNLIHGPPVNVATPTFTYNQPVGAPANVVAVIVPPPPPVPPPLQFGDASWVKEIKTTTHNANKVELVDLVDPDPNNPAAKNWANGEPAEVEVEWKLLQTDFQNPDNAKGVLQGAKEDLPGGNEVITRRYEFYKYTGPLDAETGEAVADAVAADGIHGAGSATYVGSFVNGNPITVTVDFSTLKVVGDFFGAQMSGFDVAPKLGLIDHLQDGELNVPYVERSVVIGGNPPYLVHVSLGALPDGLTLDSVSGILSGTPTVSGTFTLTVEVTDTVAAPLTKQYTLNIAGPVVAPATVTRSGFRYNRATGRFVQWVTVKNGTQASFAAPLSLVLDGLSANATLYLASGTTASLAPLGSPYIDLNLGAGGSLGPGQSVTATLEFTNPSYQGIAYTPRVVAGPGTR
jgi:hypothetical protein